MKSHWSQCPKYALVLSLAVFLSPAAGWAAGESSTAAGSAKAKLIQPLAISPNSDGAVNFGTLIKNSLAAPVKVTVDPRVSLTPSITSSNPAGVTPLSGHADANFQVTGEPGNVIQVTLPASILIKKGAGGTAGTEMTVNDFNVDVWDTTGGPDLHDDTSEQFAMPADGSATLEIGATLTVEPTDEFGDYVGSFNVTVSYV